MTSKVGVTVAVVVVGILIWLAAPDDARRGVTSQPGRAAPDTRAPLPVPSEADGEHACRAPTRWRLARIDPEFGLTEEEAAALLAEAARMWNDAVGRPVLAQGEEAGLPIRMVYDERQARTAARLAREAEVERAEERARRLAVDAATAGSSLERRAREQELGLREFEARVEEHNREVRALNGSGGVPPAVAERLREAEATLSLERAALDSVTQGLGAEESALRSARARADTAAAEARTLRERLVGDFPPLEVESATYREGPSVAGRGGVAAGSEIRIFRFASREELRLIAAHELGHALGVGHVDEPAALMHSSRDGAGGSGLLPGALHDADIEAFRATCPTLPPVGL